jgi:hypothetical protein
MMISFGKKSDVEAIPKTAEQPAQNTEQIDSTILVGTARLLYNQDDQKLSILTHEGIQSVIVERPQSWIAFGPPYDVTFVFLPYQGPFRIEISGTGEPFLRLEYRIVENEPRFVKMRVNHNKMAHTASHEVVVRFFREQ